MQDSLGVLAILSLNVVICEWLCRHTFFRHFGTTLLVILFTAVVANIGVIPSASNAPGIYGGIFTYVAPISIFFLLLGVNLSHLKKAGVPMLIMFFAGAASTAIGSIIAIQVVGGEALGANYKALAGMMTGTYIGGSVNFNAIALHYDVAKDGSLYAGTVAVDNILTALWMICSLLFPKLLQKWMPRKQLNANEQLSDQQIADIHNEHESIDPMQLALLIFMGAGVLWLSNLIAGMLAQNGINFPSILILTTFALIMAQVPAIQRINGAKLLGLYAVYLFLAVIGAFCELAALGKIGSLAIVVMAFTTTIVVIHGLIIYFVGGVLKQDWDLVAVASQANIGGPSSAMALAKSLNRTDLILPSILVGTLGAGVGTYIGFFVAEVVL